MPYNLSWYTPHKVLHLELIGQMTDADYEAVNVEVQQHTEAARDALNVVVDLRPMQVAYGMQHRLEALRASLETSKLDWVYFVSDAKLKRLVVLLAFSITPIRLTQYETFDAMTVALARRGYENELAS